MKGRMLSVLSLACLLLALTLAYGNTHTIVSNVYQDQTVVTPSLPLTITPDPGGGGGGGGMPMPKATSAGTPLVIYFDYQNPNPTRVYGMLLLTVTAPSITTNDVHITSISTYGLTVTNEGTANDTITYLLSLGGTQPYLGFDPGERANFTAITFQYNTPGTYNWTLSAVSN